MCPLHLHAQCPGHPAASGDFSPESEEGVHPTVATAGCPVQWTFQTTTSFYYITNIAQTYLGQKNSFVLVDLKFRFNGAACWGRCQAAEVF